MWILENEKKKLLTDSCYSPRIYAYVILRKFLRIPEFASNTDSWQKIYIKSKRLTMSAFIFLAFLI